MSIFDNEVKTHRDAWIRRINENPNLTYSEREKESALVLQGHFDSMSLTSDDHKPVNPRVVEHCRGWFKEPEELATKRIIAIITRLFPASHSFGGSRYYGTNTDDSDWDIFVLDTEVTEYLLETLKNLGFTDHPSAKTEDYCETRINLVHKKANVNLFSLAQWQYSSFTTANGFMMSISKHNRTKKNFIQFRKNLQDFLNVEMNKALTIEHEVLEDL